MLNFYIELSCSPPDLPCLSVFLYEQNLSHLPTLINRLILFHVISLPRAFTYLIFVVNTVCILCNYLLLMCTWKLKYWLQPYLLEVFFVTVSFLWNRSAIAAYFLDKLFLLFNVFSACYLKECQNLVGSWF